MSLKNTNLEQVTMIWTASYTKTKHHEHISFLIIYSQNQHTKMPLHCLFHAKFNNLQDVSAHFKHFKFKFWALAILQLPIISFLRY